VREVIDAEYQEAPETQATDGAAVPLAPEGGSGT
jgi:hypothetical protein